MATNKELLQTDLSLVTKDLMKQAFWLALRDGVTIVAPLGFSGDTIMLFGDEYNQDRGHRQSSVSFRMYCENVEMLITDIKGNFLFYGRYRKEIGVEVVLEEYWRMFNLVKPFILRELPSVEKRLNINPKVTYTEGWIMLGKKIPTHFKPTFETKNIFRNLYQKFCGLFKKRYI